MSSLGQIEVLLSGAWRGKGFRHFLELLRSLSSRIEMVLTMLDQNTVIRKRRQDPETWFFLAVYDLFAILTGAAEPGIAGPWLQRRVRSRLSPPAESLQPLVPRRQSRTMVTSNVGHGA
jgi:hypothetical protein